MLLADGDITKRDKILWSYTFEEVEPYAKYMGRKVLFREAVIKFLVGETKSERMERLKEQYRKLAEKAGKKLPKDFNLKELN